MFCCRLTCRGEKLNMLAHTYPHKPLRRINVATWNHQAYSPLCVWPGVWSGDLQFAYVLRPEAVVVVVQWLDYLAVTQEPGVRFPTAEKVASNVASP